ncbi:hypothetical protein HPB47_011942 [Ixodes persulcatus]|uniref:Uncharacterized protein n=1 Tax=Ixodes persulcatus TaxID=34615 RepID=A0AC60NUY5_IXOPE|nr:hypothetical protein HPB47_011942 [Ixodes persulcatus]
MPTVCLVRNCSTTYRSAPNIRFHNLPREQHRRALWLRAIDRDGPDDIFVRVGYLCSDHFLPGDYETNIQVRQSGAPGRRDAAAFMQDPKARRQVSLLKKREL